MIESFEYKGKWKLPNKNEWYNGVLRFSPQDGADLEIFGSFNEGFVDRRTQEIIVGDTTNGKITLVDNFYESGSHRFDTSVTIGKYRPSYIIVGEHFENQKEISFRSASFKLFNLFEWLGINGTEIDLKEINGDYTVKYSKPSEIRFEYFEGCNGNIFFFSPINTEYAKIEISEESCVQLNYLTKRNFIDILMDIYTFTGFTTLCTFEQSYPTLIDFYDEDFKEHNIEKRIQCYYQNNTYSLKYKNLRHGKQLINYSLIKNDFPKLIKNWYQKYNEIKPVFSLMLYTFRDKYKFSEDKFMDVIRALETFHRRTQNRTKLPQDDFDTKIKNILDKVEESDKKWLQESLEYANELNLKNRLKDLINDYSNSYIKTKTTDIKRFTFEVVNSRNYYTHYNHNKEHLALKDKDLFELNQILLGLLISCVFKYVGLEDKVFEEQLKRVLH